ncbi:related to reductases [Cephalotrichum gorgonifer]|uniref:Related to reductases n=1 Tax=Cephalotrichum gorgonifer TaxID=2041049 RepID=A0AAE8N8B5_9PEZI|nr:related to reductases [Cephalotrichum gorgonifer]
MSRYQAAHENPSGPGDARPTALQIVEDEGRVGELTGKTVFITGANQGLGLETARALLATGATIYLGVRDLKKGQQAVDDLLASGQTTNKSLHLIEISLDSLDSVRSAAEAFLSKTSSLNILILNAGIMASPKGKTKDGFESQFGICHVGHFLLFQLLKGALLAGSTPEFNSRVVSLSSIGHRCGGIRFDDLRFDDEGSYDPWVAYGQAKTANIYTANEIERRYGAKGIHGLPLHPGGIATNLGQYLDPEFVKVMSSDPEVLRYMKSPEQGAATSVYAAISKEWEGRGGRYLADCAEQGPMKPGTSPLSGADVGYAPWAYDEEKSKKLWTISCGLVGVQDAD